MNDDFYDRGKTESGNCGKGFRLTWLHFAVPVLALAIGSQAVLSARLTGIVMAQKREIARLSRDAEVQRLWAEWLKARQGRFVLSDPAASTSVEDKASLPRTARQGR